MLVEHYKHVKYQVSGHTVMSPYLSQEEVKILTRVECSNISADTSSGPVTLFVFILSTAS